MDKIKINANTHFYPMPMTLVGTFDGEKANFSPIAWLNRVNFNPPILAAGINKNHYTAKQIDKNKFFSVNIPSKDLVVETDYCGLSKGQQEDKSRLFTVFYGESKDAPMIKECPVNMECKLLQTVELPTNNLYIAEIVRAYSSDEFLEDSKLDIQKIQPFTLTMPDNQYWLVGENIGKAWSIGRNLKEKD